MLKSNCNIFQKCDSFEKYKDIRSICIFNNNRKKECYNEKSKITIVIPTYNRPHLLKDAIDSAINQDTNVDYNILIVDNNPERGDATELLMQKYNLPDIAYYKNEENIGMLGNWNRCIELANTTYITFLHDDDLLIPSSIQTLTSWHSSLNRVNAGIFGRRHIININNQIIHKYNEKDTYLKGFIKKPSLYRINNARLYNLDLDTGCGSLLNRECLIKLGGFNNDLYPAADYILFINYAIHYDLYRINKITRNDRHIENSSMKIYKMFAINNFLLRKKIVERFYHSNFLLMCLAKILYKIAHYKISKIYNPSNKLRKPVFSSFISYFYNKFFTIYNLKAGINGK